jgi:hypothetical protein
MFHWQPKIQFSGTGVAMLCWLWPPETIPLFWRSAGIVIGATMVLWPGLSWLEYRLNDLPDKRRKMFSIFGMIICLVGFAFFAATYFGAFKKTTASVSEIGQNNSDLPFLKRSADGNNVIDAELLATRTSAYDISGKLKAIDETLPLFSDRLFKLIKEEKLLLNEYSYEAQQANFFVQYAKKILSLKERFEAFDTELQDTHARHIQYKDILLMSGFWGQTFMSQSLKDLAEACRRTEGTSSDSAQFFVNSYWEKALETSDMVLNSSNNTQNNLKLFREALVKKSLP